MAGETQNKVPQPYLARLAAMQHAFPALGGFLEKLNNDDAGRRAVDQFYLTRKGRSPGRCMALDFSDKKQVTPLKGYANGFASAKDLDKYLKQNTARDSRQTGQRRLFILEDMERDYVEALGYNLGIDPLVFSEQMNTWNFTDSRSVPHRALPSMIQPRQSFTLRYYEIRTLEDDTSVSSESFQMTFAANRRKYERWRDVDAPQNGEMIDKAHAVVRRCASFWTSQVRGSDAKGWDAVILVDPGMAQASTSEPSSTKTEATRALILQDWERYSSRITMWSAHPWDEADDVCQRDHVSWPYHQGCATMGTPPTPLPDLTVPNDPDNPSSATKISTTSRIAAFISHPIPASPLDEQVHHWTSLAPPALIASTHHQSSNAAYYLLKQLAQHWTSQLELLNCTVAKGEYISDDYQAKIDDTLTSAQWKADLLRVQAVTGNINYVRRQVNHFWRAMVLNLERLGCGMMDNGPSWKEGGDGGEWDAVLGAQRDFKALSARLMPLRERTEVLANIASDLANLRAAFKGIRDGEFGMRLSLFAAVVFPLTLVASMLSMGDDFLPGKSEFWIFWACSLPLTVCFGLGLVYGKRPDLIWGDLKWLVQGEMRLKMKKREREDRKRAKMVDKRRSGLVQD